MGDCILLSEMNIRTERLSHKFDYKYHSQLEIIDRIGLQAYRLHLVIRQGLFI